MKKRSRSPVVTGILFIIAIVMLLVGGIGGAQAVLQKQSVQYNARMRYRNIGVSLLESTKSNGSDPKEITTRYYGTNTVDGSWTLKTGNLVEDMLKDTGDSELKIGKEYPFYLQVKNPRGNYKSGAGKPIDEYVRVTLYKYWVDSEGQKQADLDPSLIEIIPSGNSGWTIRDESPSKESMVFYYSGILGMEDQTSALTKGIRIKPEITDLVTIKESSVTAGGQTTNTTEYVYLYDGMKFVVEVQVDAVQAKHSRYSVPSAWGVDYVG